MSRRTPCPDLVHLRLFFHKPASAPDADTVRAHLAQCEICRAIMAGFEAGDGIMNTLADEPVFLTQRVASPAETVQLFGTSAIAAVSAGGDSTPQTLADAATMADARSLAPRGTRARLTGQ